MKQLKNSCDAFNNPRSIPPMPARNDILPGDRPRKRKPHSAQSASEQSRLPKRRRESELVDTLGVHVDDLIGNAQTIPGTRNSTRSTRRSPRFTSPLDMGTHRPGTAR